MAPAPDNVTVKVFLDYTVADDSHTLLIRAADGFNELDFLNQRDDLYDRLLQESAANVTLLQERVQLPGNSFSTPIRTLDRTGDLVGSLTGDLQPRQYTFLGRGSDGRRFRMAYYGLVGLPQTDDWRINLSESDLVADVYSIINQSPFTFVTITGSEPVFLPYASVTFNRRQIRRQRG